MLNFIKNKAKKYNLEVEFLNDYILKIYSKKYNFDSWLIKENKDNIQLFHMSKKRNLKKCSYHLQREVEKHEGIYLLENIADHNRYKAFFKGFNRTNLVDRVLNSKTPEFSVR